MSGKLYKNNIPQSEVNEPAEVYSKSSSQQANGFVFETEDERLLKDAELPAIEKLKSFTRMIRRNAMLSKLNPK